VTSSGTLPRVLSVATQGAADFRTIAAAVAAAPAGAQVRIGPGVYEETVTIGQDLELVADGPPGSVRLVHPTAPLTIASGTVLLRDLALWQGQPARGGLARFTGSRGSDEPVPAQVVPPAALALQVRGGTVRVEGCRFSAASGMGVGVRGLGTTVDMSGSNFFRVTGGLCVLGGAVARLDGCEFNEWALDALWVSRAGSRLEVRRSSFLKGGGQGIFVDFAGTAIVEDNTLEDMRVGVFVDQADTEALITRNRVSQCVGMGISVSLGARAALEGNAVSGCAVGLQVVGAGTAIESTADTLDGNEAGLAVLDGASASAGSLTVTGGDTGVLVAGAGSHLVLHDSAVSGAKGSAVKVRTGARLELEGGQLAESEFGLFAQTAGTSVVVRKASISGHRGPGISIGAGVSGTVESCEIFQNAFPGFVAVGGSVQVFENRVHDNRSNGIALRGGAKGRVEGNEVWANDLPAITVVGLGTHGIVRENSVHDNAAQGIYVFEGASAEVTGNRIAGTVGPAITVSDAGTSAVVRDNRITGGGESGIWVADGASARVELNHIEGVARAGIFVDDGARAEVLQNSVTGSALGVLVDHAGGNFVGNNLRGNAAGSWCLLHPVGMTLDGNDEDALDIPAWAAAVLDPGLYPLFAIRVGLEAGVQPREVGILASVLSLPALAKRLQPEELKAWPDVVKAHISAERASTTAAHDIADRAIDDPDAVRLSLVAHLELESLIQPGRPSRPTPIAGVVETLSVRGSDGAGVPLKSTDALGPVDELFELGEGHIRDGLRVEELPQELLATKAFRILGPYSGSAALLHLVDWCPQVLGAYGALVLVGNAESLIVVPLEDTSIIYLLPAIVGAGAGSWASASWKLRPVVVWLSHDRTDVFEIEVGSGQTINSVRAPRDLELLLGRLPEPVDRIPAGWQSEVGLTPEQASRLLPIVRLELLSRISQDIAEITAVNPRTLVDLATIVHGQPPETWAGAIHGYFDEMVADRAELDRLTHGAPFEEVRPRLWVQLDRNVVGVGAIHRGVAGLTASIVLHSSGARKRLVTRALAPALGVTEDDLWAAAESNIVEAEVQVTSAGGPVSRYAIDGHEAEALGLLLSRRPGACPNGYLVGLIHKGTAYAMPLVDATSIHNAGPFGSLIVETYRQAAAFNDELSSHLFWLKPDGSLVDLFDAIVGPVGAPPDEFRALAAKLMALQ
jgi:nitrous oxidase accessory protein NosD